MMAVYEGARPRPILSPGRWLHTAEAPERPLARRRVRATIRAQRRSNRVGIVLGAIVVGFLLAFLSLAQTMRVSASGYETERLLSQRDRLEAQRAQLVSDLNRLGGVPAIRKQAIDLGLGQLAEPLVVPAR